MKSKGTIISLCDRTGNMVLPWLEGGYDAITVDLKDQVNPHPRRQHIIKDVTDLDPSFSYLHNSCMTFAFPPCTDLAVSGAKWFRGKGLEKFIEALRVVAACKNICGWNGEPWMLENPVGVLSSRWREPDYYFDPCDYGDPYTKKTCLWVGNGFVMPEKVHLGDMFSKPTVVKPTLGSMIHKMPPSKDRGDKRSITPIGFARAVFMANAERHARLEAVTMG